ncbi:MAG: hypothetical protein OXH64_12130 [Rhodospirillaceae bacterium]|nr:hypothetical protein [Rhodospirillaceae bacterium]
MPRLILPTVVLALVLAAPDDAAGKVTEFDRFQLWTGCAPVAEIIDDIDGAVGRLTLDERDIATAVRSRLRGARIFDDGGLWLVVNVTVSGPAFSVDVELLRSVEVRPKGTKALSGLAATWESGSTGTHGNNPNHILFAVLRHVDKFIDEYLRVNKSACRNLD